MLDQSVHCWLVHPWAIQGLSRSHTPHQSRNLRIRQGRTGTQVQRRPSFEGPAALASLVARFSGRAPASSLSGFEPSMLLKESGASQVRQTPMPTPVTGPGWMRPSLATARPHLANAEKALHRTFSAAHPRTYSTVSSSGANPLAETTTRSPLANSAIVQVLPASITCSGTFRALDSA